MSWSSRLQWAMSSPHDLREDVGAGRRQASRDAFGVVEAHDVGDQVESGHLRAARGTDRVAGQAQPKRAERPPGPRQGEDAVVRQAVVGEVERDETRQPFRAGQRVDARVAEVVPRQT